MDLLEQYSKLVSNIQTLSEEIPEMREQLRGHERMLSQYKRERSNLDIERSRRQTTLMAEELDRLTAIEYSKINTRQAEVDSKLSLLSTEHSEALAAIASEKYESQLARKYAIREKLNDTLNKYTLPENIPSELSTIVADHLADTKQKYSEKSLLKLIDDVHEAYDDIDMQGFDSGGKINSFIDFISFKQLNNMDMHNRTRLYVYLGYLIALIVGCFTVPVVPIVWLGVSLAATYKKSISDNKNWIEFILPYSSLENGLKFINDEIQASVAKLREKATIAENEQYQLAVMPLNQERAQLEAEYAQAAELVRSSISSEELQARVAAQFDETIAKCEQNIADEERSINRTQKFIHSNEERIPKLKEKQKELLVEIKESYLNPKEPGTSRRLVKSFFLGIDENQGTLIEFKYDGKTTLIMYKGENCGANKDLISMMLMQLLSSMSMTSLNIYLTDLRSAGTDYAVFFQSELEGKMHLCATDKDVNNAITSLHTELIMRTKDILTEAESLEQYNEDMLARKSLPREYIFFLLQDPTPRDMERQELQQILHNGPTVGIIPIVFLKHADIMHGFKSTGDSIAPLVNFFQAFRQCSFTFDGATSDLTATPDLSATIINMLKKGTKSR